MSLLEKYGVRGSINLIKGTTVATEGSSGCGRRGRVKLCEARHQPKSPSAGQTLRFLRGKSRLLEDEEPADPRDAKNLLDHH